MAGTAKPNVVGLRGEASYTLIGGVGESNSKPSGLFNGVQANEWSSANVMYWNNASNYIEIDILSVGVNIWRSGTTSWKTYIGQLKIEKWNGYSYDDVTSQYTQVLTAITETQWEKTITNLPKGRYKFSYSSGLRLDSEWFIEDISIYKTFILHNGEYKKYHLGTPTIIDVNTAIPIMTSNTTPNGEAITDSINPNGYLAWNAFDSVLTNSSMWAIKQNDILPRYLGYKFQTAKTIGGYSLYYNWTSAGFNATPNSWTFEGSNDGINWTVLDTRSGITWTLNEEKRFNIGMPQSFLYYRILISSDNGRYNGYIAITEMKMFEVKTSAIPSSWSDYSDTLPTVDQFISDGMSDLSALDRKAKVETIVMNDDINGGSGEVLGNGKVFKETIDLTKYFDIVSLDIK